MDMLKNIEYFKFVVNFFIVKYVFTCEAWKS